MANKTADDRASWGAISSQIPNTQLSTLSPELQGEGSGYSETGQELGIGLGTAVIGSIMFSMAIGGFVDTVARQAVEGFQVASGALVVVILLSLLLASFIPQVKSEKMIAGETCELVADVSSKRL